MEIFTSLYRIFMGLNKEEEYIPLYDKKPYYKSDSFPFIKKKYKK